jgi:arylsulfatase A-like enzyme
MRRSVASLFEIARVGVLCVYEASKETPMLAALALLAAAAAAATPTARPNVVLIVTDDLGYGDLSSYGAPDAKTPNLDRLAREGVRLTDFYANGPVCSPTRAGLITGRYQQRVLIETPLTVDLSAKGLPVRGRSLPEFLKRAGYRTALLGKWHLGYQPEYSPNSHGFEYFWGYLAGWIHWYEHVRADAAHDLWENDKPATHEGYFDEEVTRRAVDYVSRPHKAPFFLEVAYGAPHWPFLSPHRPSKALRREDGTVIANPPDNPATREDYVEILEAIDTGVGRVLAALREGGLERDTLVVFTSDNGGERLSRNDPFFHSKGTLWEGGIRVPAILRWPGALPAESTSPQVAITMDLTATILAAARAEVPPDARLEGIDLRPLLDGSAPGLERTLFWRIEQRGRSQRAVRQGDWKLLRDGGHHLLYALRADPGERHNLAARHPERVRQMLSLLEAWEADVDAEAKAPAGP